MQNRSDSQTKYDYCTPRTQSRRKLLFAGGVIEAIDLNRVCHATETGGPAFI
jgi:hypothetical protein